MNELLDTKVVLVIAAHPDDEVLGCGATIARLAGEGMDVYTLILGEGVTSRDASRDAVARAQELEDLKKTACRANAILGVRKVFFGDFPDNRFDSIALLDVIKKVEAIVDYLKPQTIFTHFRNDLNIDHRVTFQAVMTAARPLPGSPVRQILSFPVLSSTEWNVPQTFSPNTFYDIEEQIEKKSESMAVYSNELRSWPHPRSLEAIRIESKMWGCRVGLEAVEPFELVRMVL